MKIIRPDGKFFEFDEIAFVDYFKGDYYLDKPENCFVCNLKNRSSRFIENEIERILKEGIKKKEEVAKLLAWKIGKIDHNKSEETSNEAKTVFVYNDGWTDVEKQVLKNESLVKLRSKEKNFPIGEIASYILDKRDILKQKAQEDDPREFFKTISAKQFKGLGTVYIFTLLYFFSEGVFPIYDQFAHKAAKAIVLNKSPNDVFVGYPPNKIEIEKALSMYSEYRWLLSLIFGDSCYENGISRDQDRALWVYGHSKKKFPLSNDVV